ncbi:cation-translocating P-type ATPase [Leptothrix discophora]|uniref:HAD-IC family P-type ATPase n=1 Tax=Leptothrix discophora TaxID=89 RepID=A0ABT9G842_LEPDI|nr:HAD-IC family P-type ATPase [Leptothrix discophora]MDP4302635.1 HAD-IC family P-type ATPase [Leptothrix discophora]
MPTPTATVPVPGAPTWHAVDPTDALRRLDVDPAVGLSAAEVARRAQRHGPNALPETAPPSSWRRLLRQFVSPLIAILGVAALLAIALGHAADAAVIGLVVVVNALIGAWQEGRADRSMASLRQLASLRVRVWRDGAEASIPARELVPGDILLLAAGDAVGADARMIEAALLQAAEAALTGESVPVAKHTGAEPEACGLADRHGMVHSGTHVTAGRGRAVVVAIGAETEVGQIADLTTRAIDPRTPLELRLDRFGRGLVIAALVLFALVLALGLLRGLPLDEVLMVAISQMVSMVPEGLPVAITIALAVGMQRMAAQGAIVRRLAAVETLGSTTVICTDKTGTLTRNEMTVTRLWLADGRDWQVGGSGYVPSGELSGAALPAAGDAALADLLRAALLCNDADLLAPDDGERSAWTALGDPTESALVVLAHKLGARAGLRADTLRQDWPRVAELPFDADTQLMATRHAGPGAPARVYLKGAPERLLRLCAGIEPAERLAVARTTADEMARGALRVLALGVVDLDAAQAAQPLSFDLLAGHVRLLGLAGQIDPPRDEVRAAVAECRAAGIRPVMVTGDHKLTGLAIARQLGMAGPEDRAIDGVELERLGEAELRAALPHVAVFARVQPAQKLRIVEAFQARGDVVAMTGDGVNDAPALARADVGVAMGRSGTEVAKGAARIVLVDDNFATLVGAVEQGRLTWGNLRKVLLYLFATSLDEVIVLMAALLAGLPLPLQAVQILWVNIVTEATLTVNLVMDPPDGDEMRRPPTRSDAALIDREMLGRLLLMALTSSVVTLAWFGWRLAQDVPLDTVRTEVFTLTVLAQWFNVLNCRSATQSVLRVSLLSNRWLMGGLLISVVLQASVLFWPPLAGLFHAVPLPASTLLAILGAASSVLVVEELRKLVARRRAASMPLPKASPGQ